MSLIRVHFDNDESRAKARWLILTNKDGNFSKNVTNVPPRDLIIDVKALKILEEEKIKVYSPNINGKKGSIKNELDISKILSEDFPV